MFGDRDLRKALDDCLARMRRGDSIDACLAAHSGQAEKLAPFLRAASIMWKIEPPRPTLQAMAQARNKLLREVEGGSGKEAGIMGVFKFANVAAVAVATFFAASLGFVAASGGADFIKAPFTGDDSVKFEARIVSTSPTLWFVERDEGFVYLKINNETRFQDASGHDVDQSSFLLGDHVGVRAEPSTTRFFDTRLIRLLGDKPGPTVKPEPTHEGTPKPEPTREATPKPTEEPGPKPTPVEPTKPTPVETAKPSPIISEFWGSVTAVNDGSLNINIQGTTPVIVYTNADTQYPTVRPFVGVKVWVQGTKNDDGSWTAFNVTVKIAEFAGIAGPVSDTQMTVTSGCAPQKIVRFDSRTVFNTFPKSNDPVYVRAYVLAENNTYLATNVTVKTDTPTVFCGTIVQPTTTPPTNGTIYVDVGGGVVRTVNYSSATVYPGVDALVPGKEVEVKVDHFDGSTYFAGPSGYVKVY